MHEISIIDELVVSLGKIAETEKLNSVSRIRLHIGKLRQVVPEVFQFFFAQAVKDSFLESAELDIRWIPVTIRCDDCGSVCEVEDNFFVCDKCKSFANTVMTGKELLIYSVEGEYGNQSNEKHSGSTSGNN